MPLRAATVLGSCGRFAELLVYDGHHGAAALASSSSPTPTRRCRLLALNVSHTARTGRVAGSKRPTVIEAAVGCRDAAQHVGAVQSKAAAGRSTAATAVATKRLFHCLPPPASSAQELMRDHLQSPESAAAHEPSQPPMPMRTMKQRIAVPMAAERAVSMLHCNICQLRHCCARRAARREQHCTRCISQLDQRCAADASARHEAASLSSQPYQPMCRLPARQHGRRPSHSHCSTMQRSAD